MPPSVSSPTRLHNSSADPYIVSRLFGQLVDMRHLTCWLPCAMAGMASPASAVPRLPSVETDVVA